MSAAASPFTADPQQPTTPGQTATATPPVAAPEPPAGASGTPTTAPPYSEAQAAAAGPHSVTVSPTDGIRPTSIAGRIYHGVLSALGGTNDVQLSRDPDTGKMVATTVAKTPGSQWKSIIAGALTGLGAATTGAGVGPGTPTRGLSLGIQAGQQQQQQQQKAKVDAANQDYDEQQKTLLRKAQLQQMATQTAAASFSLERNKVDAAGMDAKMLNDHQAFLRENGGEQVGDGPFKDFAEAAAYIKKDPTLASDYAHGRVTITPHIEDNKVTGIDVSRVPATWGDQMITENRPMPRVEYDDKGNPKQVFDTVPAGTMKQGDYTAAFNAQTANFAKLLGDKAELDYKKQQTATSKTEAGKNNAEAAKAYAEAKQLNTATDASTIDSNAQQLVDGTMDPANLSKRAKSYDATLAAANRYSLQTTGHPFDPAKAAADYKFASSQQTKNTLNFLNSLTGRDNKSGNLGTVVAMSKKLGQGQYPALNNIAQWAKISSGNPDVAAYRAALTETSDQIAKILQGGGTGSGTSDAKLNQAQELLNRSFNAKQVAETAETLRTLLGNRKEETIGDNRYLLKWYGQPQQITVTDPKGGVHVFPDMASANTFKKAAGIP